MSILQNIANGRVNIFPQEQTKPPPQPPDIQTRFKLYKRIPVADNQVMRENILSGIWQDTPMCQAFFSPENRQILQNGIRYGVYVQSHQNYIVAPVDEDELMIVMRSIYLQHSANLPDQIPEQISELNKMVMDYCIANVFSAAQGQMGYIRDASTLVEPIPLPILSQHSDKYDYPLPGWFSNFSSSGQPNNPLQTQSIGASRSGRERPQPLR
jgi:hypothetical protein